MTDTITIKLDNLTVQLPESHVIVSKEEYLHLQEEASQGRYMTLAQVLDMLQVSRPWLLDNILYKPAIRSQIDIDYNKTGFVKYPQNKGGKYLFLASKTKAFFEQHFSELLKET
ncbi:hypothetical protein STRDD10_01141 [Streptococcus sp. DD10]|uniref:DUF771 domain-containing protein n=1 Tax=Streptococcus sp. DD10 TaxID=1777878 RepID=UPI000799730B|nr:DUF771 domain-containing protein [Streptococcus sp. DD10]KXT74181.1 hypothetical protein STRDD10_01141 [Streptococcus sp. DD10]